MSLFDVLKGVLGYGTPDEYAVPSQKKAESRESLEVTGQATQLPDVSAKSDRATLIIGLDFGTAFTKVVVGEVRMKIAIPLDGDGSRASHYLLPSRYGVDEEGVCHLSASLADVSVVRSDIKIELLERHFDESVLVRAAVFLALVFRRVRGFLFDSYRNVYRSKSIEWMVNVGVPTDSFHDDGMVNAYRKAVSTAWVISASDEDITEDAAKKKLASFPFSDQEREALHQEMIGAFPEFAAQVTGYVRSPLRQRDLHALVDVGAGTLDMTIFNVHEEDGEDVFPIFAKAVEQLGTRYLVRHRLEPYGRDEKGQFSPFQPVLDKSGFAASLGVDESEIARHDARFKSNVVEAFFALLRATKERKYPQSRCWDTGVPVFLCGGGSNCDLYSDIFASESLKFDGTPLVRKILPKPGDLEADAIDGEGFDRLSVAYGLAFEIDNIGEIQREGDFEDADALPLENRDGVICTYCNGSGGLHGMCDVCGGSGFA